jgi:hypothetical protein
LPGCSTTTNSASIARRTGLIRSPPISSTSRYVERAGHNQLERLACVVLLRSMLARVQSGSREGRRLGVSWTHVRQISLQVQCYLKIGNSDNDRAPDAVRLSHLRLRRPLAVDQWDGRPECRRHIAWRVRRGRPAENPLTVYEIWHDDFVWAVEHAPGGVFDLCMHPQAIGRGHRLAMVQRLIGEKQMAPGVHFERLGDYAARWRKEHPLAEWVAGRPAQVRP